MNTVIGHRISRFSANIMNLCFYPILGVVLAFFSVEAIFAIFNGYNQPIYLLVITTIGLTILFVSLNFISEKISMKAGVIAGYIKFLPMIICVIACIVIVIKGNNINFFDNSQTQVSVGSFNVLNVLDSLPATLFAFNGYLVVGEMGHKIKDPQKNTGRAIIIAVLIIAGIYIATSLTLIIVGDANGNVLAILNLIFGDNVGPRIMSCVLLFVALGSTISFLMVSFHTITKQIENKDLVGYDKLKRLNNKRHNLGNLVGTSLVLSV
jgi:amino acid transporter